MAHSKFEINSAIEKLITKEHFDVEAAQIVVDFGSKIPLEKLSASYSNKKSKKDSQTGFAENFGNVTIDTEKKPHESKKDFGVSVERIGKYKISRCNIDESIFSIRFHHFWASENATKSESKEITVYHLLYDKDSLRPLSLGVEENILSTSYILFPILKILTFNKLNVYKNKIYVSIFLGENKGKRIWLINEYHARINL